jgi:carbonic anhydrase
MSNLTTLLNRNKDFKDNFNKGELQPIPKLRSVVLTCADARVDPAHILNLDLGESLVMRNTGGRVTKEIIEEIASIAFMVAQMDGEKLGPFELLIMHHTNCGAERFTDPNLQNALKNNLGIDVRDLAINNHTESLREDIEKLKKSPQIPDYITVSGCIYDVKDGSVEEVFKPLKLSSIKKIKKND